MPPPETAIDSSTGSTLLPDEGELSYNGVTFGCLYTSRITGKAVKDEANRTVKWMEYTLAVDGVVTLTAAQAEAVQEFDAAFTTDDLWINLRRRLNAQGGQLTYKDKGFGLNVVNTPNGGGQRDLANGPIPDTLEFTPLGAGRSAFIKWTVVVHISDQLRPSLGTGGGAGGGGLPPVLQFNYETSLSYDDEGYSTRSWKGALEIAITRPTQGARTITATVDDLREFWVNRIADKIDLLRFRVTKRHFNVSRDKRFMDWEFTVEELPPMGLPPWCTNARGHYDVRPFRIGPAFTSRWVCSLKCTYAVRKDRPRQLAYDAFVSLWHWRMNQSANSVLPTLKDSSAAGQTKPPVSNLAAFLAAGSNGLIANAAARFWRSQFATQQAAVAAAADKQKAIPINFAISEGVYLDSKTVTFEASWWLHCTFKSLIKAAGVWHSAGEAGRNLWATTMRDVQGSRSWLENRLDPNADVIVDFGSS